MTISEWYEKTLPISPSMNLLFCSCLSGIYIYLNFQGSISFHCLDIIRHLATKKNHLFVLWWHRPFISWVLMLPLVDSFFLVHALWSRFSILFLLGLNRNPIFLNFFHRTSSAYSLLNSLSIALHPFVLSSFSPLEWTSICLLILILILYLEILLFVFSYMQLLMCSLNLSVFQKCVKHLRTGHLSLCPNPLWMFL
jgi:hypothetical protein